MEPFLAQLAVEAASQVPALVATGVIFIIIVKQICATFRSSLELVTSSFDRGLMELENRSALRLLEQQKAHMIQVEQMMRGARKNDG